MAHHWGYGEENGNGNSLLTEIIHFWTMSCFNIKIHRKKKVKIYLKQSLKIRNF